MKIFARIYLTVAGLSLYCSGACAVDLEVPEAIKTKYKYLYDQEPEQLSDGSFKFDKARLFNREGLNVLYLHGDEFEMGYKHGRLLHDQIAEGQTLKYISELVRNNILNNLGDNFISRRVVNYAYNNITHKIIDYALADSELGSTPLLPAWGLSEASGVSMETIIRAALAPETLQVLLATTSKGIAGFLGLNAGDTGQGCSGFAAWGKTTRDGEMIFGRNTDYPLNGHYDRYPTVIYFDPADGSQKFMGMTSAGLHNAGVVGYNESGIFVGSHTVPTLNASTEGYPIFFVSQAVLRKATTIAEAVAIFKKIKPAAGWSFVIASAKEKTAVTIEMNNDSMSVLYPTGDFHVQSNYYLTPELIKENYRINMSVDEDAWARYSRMSDLISESKGTFDHHLAMLMLGDKFDPFIKQTRGSQNTISVQTTLASVVFTPKRGSVLVAVGEAPVSTRKYVELPLVENFDPETFGDQPYESHINDQFQREYPKMAEAEQIFIQAKMVYEYNNDAKSAYALLKDVTAKDNTNPAYFFIKGILALKSGHDEEAIQAFTDIYSTVTSSQLELLGHYYLARTYAHLGKKDAAYAEIAKVENHLTKNEELLKAAKKLKEKLKFRSSLALDRPKLSVMFQQADMIEYK